MSESEAVVEDELDELHLECWRVFTLFSLQGNVKSVDQMSLRSFSKFIKQMDLPPNKRKSINVEHIFAHAATNTGLGGKQKRSTLCFQTFLLALDELAVELFTKRSELFGATQLPQLQAFGKLMYDYILDIYPERLPYEVEDADAVQFLECVEVSSLIKIFSPSLKLLFDATSGHHKYLLYDRWQRFCSGFFNFANTSHVLSKLHLGQIFLFSAGKERVSG